MTTMIGTIGEMTGEGYEILVDHETRSIILARFFYGNFMSQTAQSVPCDEPTIVL